METYSRNQRSGEGWREDRPMENMHPRLVDNNVFHRRNILAVHKVFRRCLCWYKGFLGGSYEQIPMNTIKSIPYILVGAISMGFVSFATMSTVVLFDMAKEEAVYTIGISMPLHSLTQINVSEL